MEAHSLSNEQAGPILRAIQELRRQRNHHEIGSEQYIALDNQVDVLLQQLIDLFNRSTPVLNEKFALEHDFEPGPVSPESSPKPTHFDIVSKLHEVVPAPANMTDPSVTTPVDPPIQESNEPDQEHDDLMKLFESGGTRRYRKKKSNTKKLKRRRGMRIF
jgi:hypothetical protein